MTKIRLKQFSRTRVKISCLVNKTKQANWFLFFKFESKTLEVYMTLVGRPPEARIQNTFKVR